MDEDKSEYWIETAEYDIESAKVMQAGGKYLYVGFMCHLAVEKALKSIIAKRGTIPPKTHTLARIAELAELSDVLSDEQKTLINELQPLNVEARYPSNKTGIAELLSETYCMKLIERAEDFVSWIKRRF